MMVKVRPILHKRLCRVHEMSFVDQAYALQWERVFVPGTELALCLRQSSLWDETSLVA
jgi:hypothetical protein